ncbi:hypothetical protein Acsp05_45620 [Actinokineospora sp. NBRC 105648]|nr:hypothetical protein Acsp05_45620 [Actinokineospora sp. NBRC 105648]
MGVACHHQVVTVLGEAVEDAGLGGVRHAQAQGGLAVRLARHVVVPVPLEVRVVDARRGDGAAVDGEQGAVVGQVDPAAFDHGGAQVLPGERDAVDALVRREQVPHRVFRLGGVVVVAAEDEHARAVEQRAERADHGGHSLLVREVVAGVDHQVRVQLVERGHPALLGLLAGEHVQVGDVQHAQGAGALGQYR